jgi:hypothetical protein
MLHINTNAYWQILITSSGLERSIAPHSTFHLPASFTDNYEIIDCHSVGMATFNKTSTY